jgi:hypothetical protein
MPRRGRLASFRQETGPSKEIEVKGEEFTDLGVVSGGENSESSMSGFWLPCEIDIRESLGGMRSEHCRERCENPRRDGGAFGSWVRWRQDFPCLNL